jgi:hypothetical protein
MRILKRILIGIFIIFSCVLWGFKGFPSSNKVIEEKSPNYKFEKSEIMNLKAKQVIFIRHAEKENMDGSIQDVDLSLKGYKRANELPDFFTNHLPDNINKPDVIIAMKQENIKHSNRPVETVQPLAKAFDIQIIANYKQSQVNKAVDDINKYGSNKTVLVCWEHQYLVKIVQSLGVSVTSWGFNPQAPKDDAMNYDAIWVITKYNDRKAEFSVYKEFKVLEDGEISYEGASNLPLFKQDFQY